MAVVNSNNTMYFGGGGWVLLELLLTVVVIIVCLVHYLMGYKHNQTIFFLQMLSFIGFAVPQEPLLRMEFLYNLRFSYFDFGNALHLAIPADYFEES
mgnify:CR=1 FL=1